MQTRLGKRSVGLTTATVVLALCLTCCLGVSSASATAAPELLAPSASHTYGSPLAIEYNLPELATSATLTFTSTTTSEVVTLGALGLTAGVHHFSLNLQNLSGELLNVAKAEPSNTLADGEYTVALAYQHLLEPAATATVAKVLIKTATLPPTLTAPTSLSVHNSPLAVKYVLPEAASAAGAKITLTPALGTPTVLSLTAAASTAGAHTLSLDTHHLAADTANVAGVSPGESIGDGVYSVEVSYRDTLGDPETGAHASGVTIKTATGAPSLSAPEPGQTFLAPFDVTYTLPEAALPGSVVLRFETGGHEAASISLAGTLAGPHTVEVVPDAPGGAAGVLTASPTSIPSGIYQLTVAYEDLLGNPLAVSTPLTVTIKRPLCTPGHFSAAGETPCAPAPAGTAAPGEGATAAVECTAGHFAPASGMSQCLPAEPGHQVPGAGAFAQILCEAGTYSEQPGQAHCAPVPLGHYSSQAGAVTPTPCPSGTHDSHLKSTSVEECELDAPGFYSGEGAGEAIPCPEGTTSGRGASSCTAVAVVAGAGSGTPTASQSPSSGAAASAGSHALSVRIAPGKKGASLRRTRRQRYTLTCSAAASLVVKVTGVVTAGRKHAAISGDAQKLSCKSGRASETIVAFRLSRAVKRLLSRHGAGVRLTVRVSMAGAVVASGVLRGRA